MAPIGTEADLRSHLRNQMSSGYPAVHADRHIDRGVLMLCAHPFAGIHGGQPLQDAHGRAVPQPLRHGLFLWSHWHRHGQKLPAGLHALFQCRPSAHHVHAGYLNYLTGLYYLHCTLVTKVCFAKEIHCVFTMFFLCTCRPCRTSVH